MVEIGRQDPFFQVAYQLLKHLLEPVSKAFFCPVRTGGTEMKDDVGQGAAAQFVQGGMALADAVQDAEAALPSPSVTGIQLLQL